MTFTYVDTLATDRDKIRRLINDVDSTDAIFSDEEIAGMLALEDSNVRRGAALALETIAGRDAYVLKVMTRGDLQTDGAKTAEALMKRAAQLRDQADRYESEDEGGAFDIAEHVFDDFSARERLEKQALRGLV